MIVNFWITGKHETKPFRYRAIFFISHIKIATKLSRIWFILIGITQKVFVCACPGGHCKWFLTIFKRTTYSLCTDASVPYTWIQYDVWVFSIHYVYSTMYHYQMTGVKLWCDSFTLQNFLSDVVGMLSLWECKYHMLQKELLSVLLQLHLHSPHLAWMD